MAVHMAVAGSGMESQDHKFAPSCTSHILHSLVEAVEMPQKTQQGQ